jgi:hypothetical protein
MTEPKFHVGQRVAVCTQDLSFILPETIVTGVEFQPAGPFCHPQTLAIRFFAASWAYTVAGGERDPLGRACWYDECSLRPIDKDEYRDTEVNSLETPKPLTA